MKNRRIAPARRRRRIAGFNLIELLGYIVLLSVVSGVVFPAFYRVMKQFRAMERNTDDIVRVMNVGERWRHDVRTAAATPLVADTNTLTLPQRDGATVVYTLEGNTVWRTAPDGTRSPVLTKVKSAMVHREERGAVTAWRWEVELQTEQPVVRVKPLFTFIAVAKGVTP